MQISRHIIFGFGIALVLCGVSQLFLSRAADQERQNTAWALELAGEWKGKAYKAIGEAHESNRVAKEAIRLANECLDIRAALQSGGVPAAQRVLKKAEEEEGWHMAGQPEW